MTSGSERRDLIVEKRVSKDFNGPSMSYWIGVAHSKPMDDIPDFVLISKGVEPSKNHITDMCSVRFFHVTFCICEEIQELHSINVVLALFAKFQSSTFTTYCTNQSPHLLQQILVQPTQIRKHGGVTIVIVFFIKIIIILGVPMIVRHECTLYHSYERVG